MIDRFILWLALPCAGVVGGVLWPLTDPSEQIMLVHTGQNWSTSTGPSEQASGPKRIAKSNDKLFYTNVEIDGEMVEMIIDTGATRTILSTATVHKIWPSCCEKHPAGSVQTLTGRTAYYLTVADKIKVGSKTIRNTGVGIIRSDQNFAVLGQDVLEQLGPIVLDGDILHLP